METRQLGKSGIAVSVRGDELDVWITGQSSDGDEHLARALRLIERVAEHGAPSSEG